MPHDVVPAALVVTDLDGTLLNADHRIGTTDRQALHALGAQRVCRVAATGRSLYSLRRVLTPADPLDFVVFSSGAGILDWSTQSLIRATGLTPSQTVAGVGSLLAASANFMVHAPVPENHVFVFHECVAERTDFRRRCALYQPYCRALQNNDDLREGASQFVVIMEPDLARFRRLAAALEGLSVVRTTSPLDGSSLWMEVFAAGTNKSGAAAFLAARLGIQRRQTYALGNDFNDADLLEWAAHACVTANAPVELRQCYPVVRSHEEAGFADAVALWGLC